MRSRPELKVLLSPGTPRPGQTFDVEARFESTSDTPLDLVTFGLVGSERVTVQRGRTTLVWKHEHLRLRAEVPGRPLTPGTHAYRARFQLPDNLPPPYYGRHLWTDYTLEVRASIPWWPDRVGRYAIPVTPPPPSSYEARPGVFVSAAGGAKGKELYAELSLAATTLEPGGEVVGTVALTNASRERGVQVALVAFERLHAEGPSFWNGTAREVTEVKRWPYVVANIPPPDGIALPFRFGIAADTLPSFDAKLASLDWAVEVATERTFWNNPVLRVPVVIVPRSAGRRPQATAVPAVGRERRAQSFQRIAERTGLTYSAEHDDLRGAAGSVGVRVAIESSADGKLATVARLAWPSLGMDLRVTAGSWTDRLSPREINVGVDAFDRRFHVQSRFPEQARALFDQALCDLLMALSAVEVDDDGAAFSVDIALVDEAPLGELVTSALQAARTFDSALDRVPLPPLLEPHAAAWRDLAVRLQGRLEPGRGAIREGTLGLERVEIVTLWSDDRAPAGTALQMPLGVRIDPTNVSPRAREHVTALEAQTQGHLVLTEDAVTLTLPGLVESPHTLDPLLEDLTRLVQSVRGRGAAGPFRS